MIKKGAWVQIHKIVLTPAERSAQIPEDSKKVPLEMWVKGYLCEDAEMNTSARIETLTGRIENGTLMAVNPSYHHDYGDFIPELLVIDRMVKAALKEDQNE